MSCDADETPHTLICRKAQDKCAGEPSASAAETVAATLSFSQLQRLAERLHKLGPTRVSSMGPAERQSLLSEVALQQQPPPPAIPSDASTNGKHLSWVGKLRQIVESDVSVGAEYTEEGVQAEAAEGAQFPGVTVRAAGYVVQVRKAGRKLLFLDVVEEPRIGAPALELIVKTPTLQEAEVLEIKRMVSRKDAVLASGWLEVVQAKGSGAESARVIMLHVEAVAVLRNHTVWVTPGMPSEERRLELVLDGLIAETRIRKNLLAIGGNDGERQCSMWGLCPVWVEKGECVLHKSGKCKWRHEYADDGERGRRQWLLERARAMREQEQDPEDPFEHDDDEEGGEHVADAVTVDGASLAGNVVSGAPVALLWPAGTTTKFSACMRAEIFVKWLVTRFGGVSVLAAGSGVLDVAGGRGAVAFELSVMRGVPCTVVDPRPIKYNRRQSSAVRRLQTDDATASEAPLPVNDSGSLIIDSGNDIGVKACSLIDGTGALSASKRKLGEIADFEGEEQSGAEVEHRPPCLPEQHKELFNDSWLVEHAALLASASCLVGMHPDQATEAIVDAALSAGKPFAVLPCCVFPRLFPERKGASSEQVVTYRQFIDYLLAKDDRIRLEYLPFNGRNKVLYVLPK